MQRIARSIYHGSVQVTAGILVGVVLDSVFPEPSKGHDCADVVDGIKTLLEVAAQTVLAGILAGELLTQIARLPEGSDDPQFGAALILSAGQSQPNLVKKLAKVGCTVRTLVGLAPPVPKAVDSAPQRVPPSNVVGVRQPPGSIRI